MREIVFDTETTGLDPLKGDRLVEIGCIELLNHIPTGQSYHVYINPERTMPADAFRVHGLSDAFLADKPLFAAIVDEFAAFIGDARLIAHNANFDIGFINAEFTRLGRPAITPERVIDTLAMARRRHPAGPNSLDALCSRYGIDASRRTVHGGLVDAELLAEVYIELIGGRQPGLVLVTETVETRVVEGGPRPLERRSRPRPVALPLRINEAEQQAHAAFVEAIGSGALWLDFAGTCRG